MSWLGVNTSLTKTGEGPGGGGLQYEKEYSMLQYNFILREDKYHNFSTMN